MKNRKTFLSIVLAGLLCVITIVLMEITCTFLFNNSSLLNGNLLKVFREYYMVKDRRIIQFLSDSGKYDHELAYVLKPGKSHIEYRESEIDYSINSIGVRDDESSLISPEIVVVGDSHAMGWGVKQDQTFSSLLESRLEKSVLNAAIASYGTVRELRILERVNLDNLKFLLIQYCRNDSQENSTYTRNCNTLPVMSEESYNSITENHEENVAYYFGKHSFYLIAYSLREI